MCSPQNCVYRFLNENNEIIYIGKAKDLKQRLNNHNHLPKECYEERKCIEYLEFSSEEDMDFIERYFIQKINPKYNTVLNDKHITISLMQLDSLTWKIFHKDSTNDKSEINKIFKQCLRLNRKRKILLQLIKEQGNCEYYELEINKINSDLDDLKCKLKSLDVNKFNDKLINICIIYETLDIESIIQDIIKQIKDDFLFSCEKDIRLYNCYCYSYLNEIEGRFVDSGYNGWIYLLPGKYDSETDKYIVDNDVKNNLVEKMILDIETELKETYGEFEEDIELTYASHICELYVKNFKSRTVKKPIIVKKRISPTGGNQ